MPNYDYKCEECEHIKEIFHSMSECENPNKETCKNLNCDCGQFFNKKVYKRQISLVEIGKYSGMNKKEKADCLVKRSREHSKKFFKDNGISKKI